MCFKLTVTKCWQCAYSLVFHKAWCRRSLSSVIRAGPYQCHGQMGSPTHSRDTEAASKQTMSARELLWQGDLVAGVQCNDTNSVSLQLLAEDSPSVVLLLFLLTNATEPALLSSEPSTELLLITLSSSFFPVTSPAVAGEVSSSSSSSWSEYWLSASTNSLKISSLMNPPSGTQSTCQSKYLVLFCWYMIISLRHMMLFL